MSHKAASSPDGWLKLYRNLMHKPIWTETTAEQKVLLISLLMKAAFSDRTWIHQGSVYRLKPGQLITSINTLVDLGGRGVTHRKVRTALDLFEKYGFLTREMTQQHTLITIDNWETYQGDGVLPTQQTTQTRHSGDTVPSHPSTPIKKLRSKEGVEGEAGGVATPPPPPPETLPHEQIVALFNLVCTGLPRVRKLSEQRRQAIENTWNHLSEMLPGEDPVKAFQQLFEKVKASTFLNGTNALQWRADFDWLMSGEKVQRVMEEMYDDVKPTALQKKVYSRQQSKTCRTGFHLPESRGANYTNDQLEAILLGKKTNRGRG